MLDTVETSGQRLDDLERGPDGVRGGVRGAGHHAVDHVVVHQHGAEIRDVVDGLAGLLDGDALVLAQFGVLLGELVAQLAGPRVEHRGRREVDAEFGRAGPDRGLVAEDRQVGDRRAAAAGPPPCRMRSSSPSGSTMRLRSDAGPVEQLVGEHLRRDDRRDRNRQLRKQIRGVDVGVHQLERGVDLALRVDAVTRPRADATARAVS